MSLAAGTRLGPYEILGLIGAGGMGEVYKAHDTRLDRTVAIKVLPADISADPDRRARFEREAKTIAGLNHPHICTLHDVGEHDGSMFLVMEHLDGETLAHRIEKGPLPIAQALTIAIEIADALSAAHRHGVIHRDLKPGNVMLTKSGAKLLDFGLAKLTGHGEQAAAAQFVSVPTRSAPITADGVIVGTLQYMAPEQLEGKPADARTDLWALGATLYEMVAGKRAVEESSAVSLFSAILEREPPALITVQSRTPRGLDRLVRRCLAKPPDDRPDTAHDLASELRWLRESNGTEAISGRAVVSAGRRIFRAVTLSLGAATLGGVFAVWASTRWFPSTSSQPVYVEISVRPAEELNAGGLPSIWLPTPGGSRTALMWTPDGRSLVFVGRRGGVQQLYVRHLDANEARPLAGTEGAQLAVVSPDGQWVAFWAGQTLKKAPLGGGPVMDLLRPVAQPPGLVWDSRGGLFFGRDGVIWQLPAGEVPKRVTALGEAERAHIPSCLLADRFLLYTVRKRTRSWGDEDVELLELATGKRTPLVRDAADARYVTSGHLVFMRRGTLFAAPLDTMRMAILGEPVPVIDAIAQATTGANPGNLTGAGQFTIAASGAIAWVPAGPSANFESRLVTIDRRGRVSPLPSAERSYGPAVRLSPDGRQLTVSLSDMTDTGISLLDLGRGVLTPLRRTDEAFPGPWSADGRHVLLALLEGGRSSLARQSADGNASPEVLAEVDFTPSSWAPGGRLFGVARDDLSVFTFDAPGGRVEPLRQTPEVEQSPEVSPDGRWLAYVSNASGRFDLYIEPYTGGPRRIVAEGGRFPAWHRNGRELFYAIPGGARDKSRMFAVDVEGAGIPQIGAPRLLFEYEQAPLMVGCGTIRCYEVAPDGQRFYMARYSVPPPPPAVTHVNVVLNWTQELKAKVPVGK